MKLKQLFSLTAIAASLTLAGCGGDINITPTSVDNSVDNSTNNSNNSSNTNTGGSGSFECASYEADGVTVEGEAEGNNCVYDGDFVSAASPIMADITLEKLANDGVHYFQSSLVIGQDCDLTQGTCTVDVDGPTLTIEAGTTLVFDNASSRVQINRGANIEAAGTYANPITFTSANAISSLSVQDPEPQDWGGIMINGLGITDQCTDAERTANTCSANTEGAVTYYGGNDNNDDSGTLKFAKIHYAGGLPAGAEEGNDLNSLTLGAVGSSTTIEYIDIYAGYDDGIELFGGAVNLKYIAITDTQDDSMDIDAGWQGNAQFVYIKHGTVKNAAGETINMGNGGFESDGIKVKGTSVDPSSPNIANVTVVTTDEESARDGAASIAIKLDDFIQASWYNTILIKDAATQTYCIDYKPEEAVDEMIAQQVSLESSVAACAQLAATGSETVTGTDGTSTITVEEWFKNGDKNELLNAGATILADNGFATLPNADSDVTVTATDMSTVDTFFETTDFIGAISTTDTSSDWYNWLNDAYTNANDE
ncbi:hypothetical protein [Catenovulum adriaticum]|uniref:Serine/threonine protein kinase n=1 Tax=Catenovulum adriaticum TaxID=2984846 RepID=A0ABY7AM21_9ALTE|nr:hypothetical protein [Catenovulum sp. TS8]WAJ69777.1 hypothetical protein OLW01_11525 [Catenovulum sp. TS8]